MDVGQIVSIVIIVLLILLGAYFAQRGARRGIVKAAMTTGNIAVSAFLACFLSRDFTTIARDYLYPLILWVMRLFGLDFVEEVLAELEGIITLAPLFLGVIITPFLFVLFFFLFRTLIGIGLLFVYRPSRKNEDGEKVKRHIPVWSRICGGVLGALNGVLLLAVVLVPVVGYTNLVSNVADAYFSEIDTSGYSREGSSAGELVYFALNDYVEPVRGNWFFKASYVTVGRPMFNHMTETAYGSGEFGLENETIVAIRLLRSGGKFISNMNNVNEQGVEGLHDIVDILDESVLMPELAATFVSEMCDNWASGKALFGLERPDFGELLNPTVDVLLNILATVDGEILIEDLNTLLEMLDLLVEKEVFGNHQDSEKLMDILGKNPDLLSELVAIFESNDHLAPMAAEIKQLCIRVLTQSLDMENLELTGDLTDTINASKDDPEKLSQELKGIVQDYLNEQGMTANVDDEITDELALAISQEFADKDYVTEDEVIDFVLSYAQGNFTDEEINGIVPGYQE